MASWIQSLFGGSGEITELPEDLQKIFVQAKRDRKALRDLLNRSEKAQQLLRDVSGPLAAVQASAEAMSQQITELQERVDTFADVSAQVDSVEQRAKELTESQSKSDTTLNDASRRVSDLNMQVRDVRSMVDEIVTAKDDLTEMAGPYGTVATLLKRVNVLREELQQMQDRGTGLKESVAQLDVVEKRIKGVSASQDELAGSLERSSSSADKLEGQVTTLHAQVEAVADARTNIAELLGPSGTVATLLTQVSVLREELREMQDHGTGLKETVAQLDVVEKRIKGVSASQDELAGSLERSSSSADKLEGQVTTLHAQVEAGGRCQDGHGGPAWALRYRRHPAQEGERDPRGDPADAGSRDRTEGVLRSARRRREADQRGLRIPGRARRVAGAELELGRQARGPGDLPTFAGGRRGRRQDGHGGAARPQGRPLGGFGMISGSSRRSSAASRAAHSILASLKDGWRPSPSRPTRWPRISGIPSTRSSRPPRR